VVRLARLRAPAWILLLSLSACANIWGFDELSTGEDAGPDVAEKPGPEGGSDVTVDQSADHAPDMNVRDVRPEADVTMPPEAGRDADSSVPDARDADSSVPDARDADATPEAAPDSTGPDVADVAPDTNDSAPDVTIEADSNVGLGTDITSMGTIVALVTAPTGVSNPNIGVISDGIFPPLNSVNPMAEYDTNDGTAKTEDWIGYEFGTQETFTTVVFQDGIKFTDGGWFTTIQIEIDADGTGTTWTPVTATVSPAYAGQTAPNFEKYTFTLTPPVPGMGIRIDGTPGGTGTYVTIGELRVFAQ
jgi:hypothetical protein